MSTKLPEYIALSVAMRSLSKHVATGYRWAQRGCRGVRLRTYLVGGARVTTMYDLETFVAAVTAAGTRPIVTDAVSDTSAETASLPRESNAARRAQRELDRRLK